MTPNFTSQPNRFPYLCTYQYTKLVSWPINAKRFAMNKHTFWHHLAMVVYSEIINLVWLLVGGVLILAGLAIFDFFKPQVEKPEELDLKFTAETLKKNAVSGVVVLAVRRISVQLIQTLSTIILARILFPETFGVFAIMVFIVEFLANLPSSGFMAAIIQKKEKIKQADLSTIFLTLLFFSLLFFFFFLVFF